MAPETPSDTDFVPFTKAERIQQLNNIDKSITSLLRSASQAVRALTEAQEPVQGVASQREGFQQSVSEFLLTLHKVDVVLNRHIHGLEEEGLVPLNPTPKEKTTEGEAPRQAFQRREEAPKAMVSVNEGGMGKLDVGFLNSRGGRVDRQMEGELWSKTKDFLKDINAGKNHTTDESEDRDVDHDMGG